MAKVTIDDKEYETDNLSEDARNRLANITFCDRKLSDLRREVATIQTARNLYARDLARKLQDETNDS